MKNWSYSNEYFTGRESSNCEGFSFTCNFLP